MITKVSDWLNTYKDHISATTSRKISSKYENDYLTSITESNRFRLAKRVQTSPQPKQVAYNDNFHLCLVSCMSGKKLQMWKLRESQNLIFDSEILFDSQCVEVATDENLAFVTLSDFSKTKKDVSKLAIIDLRKKEILSTIATGGEWSKFIKIFPEKNLLFISNWKSNNISIISYETPKKPKIIQVIPCGISPRGIDITKDGSRVLVACYYSRNIVELAVAANGYEVSQIGEPFDYPNYSGNMRDIVIDGKFALVTNMGRNCVHKYDIERKVIVESWLVGKYPNSVRKLDGLTYIVSCRESDSLVAVDSLSGEIKLISNQLKSPTGLCVIKEGILATGFDSDELLYFY